jgi:peptide/nickel transport system substrate-binding protein
MLSSPMRMRGVALAAVFVLAVTACGGTSTSNGPSAGAPSAGAPSAGAPSGAVSSGGAPSAGASQAAGKTGGTIFLLENGEGFDQVDPQRVYTGEDLAFFGATIYRSLTAYVLSPDLAIGTSLTPDLATDLGTATDGGKTWAFTLRDGATFQDGTPITCKDVAYGTSRTFAKEITQGPTYAVQYLDIPADPAGGSAYKGPYTKVGQALFDKAVTCSADGKTITFHLSQPHADFNYTVTLGFSPVPAAADKGEKYGTGTNPVSSGPYMIESYTTGKGGKMVLVRNPKWNQASDPYRHPYPDKWEVDFGLDVKVIDQRLIQSSGPDATALSLIIQPENLATVFVDPKTTQPDFTGRAVSDYDVYALYYWINQKTVKNVKIRQAMAVALDREAIRKNVGGAFVGPFADGVIKPNVGIDFAPSGMWTDMFGQPVPDKGDPEFAKKLIAESGEPAPTLTLDYRNTPVAEKTAAIVVSSLGLAGITVKPNPIETGKYYSTVYDTPHDFGAGGWGADWPNASTVIPPMFTTAGGWDLSKYEDPAYNAKILAAQSELDRSKQALDWQALNKDAMKNVLVIPTFFELQQRMAGTGVQTVYLWSAYGSWPYGSMSVK